MARMKVRVMVEVFGDDGRVSRKIQTAEVNKRLIAVTESLGLSRPVEEQIALDVATTALSSVTLAPAGDHAAAAVPLSEDNGTEYGRAPAADSGIGKMLGFDILKHMAKKGA